MSTELWGGGKEADKEALVRLDATLNLTRMKTKQGGIDLKSLQRPNKGPRSRQFQNHFVEFVTTKKLFWIDVLPTVQSVK